MKAIVLEKNSDYIYRVKIGHRELKAHVNQLSKYEFRHKIFDVLGAKQVWKELSNFCMDRSKLTEAESAKEKSSERPKRIRRAPVRFEPEYFKTRNHRVRPSKPLENYLTNSILPESGPMPFANMI